MNLTIKDLRREIQQSLSQVEEIDAFHESFLIVSEVLMMSLSQQMVHADQVVLPEQEKQVREYCSRRRQGEPMAYILGYKDFYKSRFIVTPDTLIPRPETEQIVEEAIKIHDVQKIADLGCGSGCLGISILLEMPQARLWACDISPTATEVTKQNATRLGVSDRISLVVSDVIKWSSQRDFDLIVANPPYIAQGDQRLEKSVLDYEPSLALFADDKGVAYFKQWLPWSYTALKENGKIFFEFGQGQAESINEIAKNVGFRDMRIIKDVFGIERVLSAEK